MQTGECSSTETSTADQVQVANSLLCSLIRTSRYKLTRRQISTSCCQAVQGADLRWLFSTTFPQVAKSPQPPKSWAIVTPFP